MTGLLTCPEFVETEQHRRLRGAILAEMGCWRRFIVAIDGVDGAGKSTLARYLAWQLEVPAVGTELFLDRERGGLTYHLDRLQFVIEARTSLNRPVIVEGVCMLQVLQDLSLTYDYLVWVEQDGCEGSLSLGSELAIYRRDFNPRPKANMVFERPADDQPGG